MSRDGQVNGHKPSRLMARVLPGPAPVSSAGVGDVPDNLAPAIASVTGLRTEVPEDAHTASLLGTERSGNAVIIDEHGLAVTIGYLLLECRRISLADAEGDWVDAAFVGYDFETGFGLVRARRPLGLDPLPLGESSTLAEGDRIVVAGQGGIDYAIMTEVVSRRSFAGYWEYYLDDALFTSPVYHNWSGAALIGSDGRMLGVGSLLVEDAGPGGQKQQGNMFVPVDLLTPILDEITGQGRVGRPPRPWLGIFTAEAHGNLVIAHIAENGPASRAGIEPGDVIVRVDREPIADLGELYRRMWTLGPAGVSVPLTVVRDGAAVEISVRSADRYAHFKTPRE